MDKKTGEGGRSNQFERDLDRESSAKRREKHEKIPDKKNYSTSGIGRTAQGSWVLKFTRYVHPNLEIRKAENDQPAGVFFFDWSGKGRLALENGQKFDWLPGDRWGVEWQFIQTARIPVMHFQLQKKWLTINAQIHLTNEIPGEPALSLMVLCGWFSRLLSAEGRQAGVSLNR